MKKPLSQIALLACFFIMGCSNDPYATDPPTFRAPQITITYPDTYRDTTQVDEHHGRTVADPYRWLEYEFSPSVDYWLKSQRSVTQQYFENVPYHNTIKNRLEKLWNHERAALPVRRGDFYYLFKNAGLAAQPSLYRSPSLADSFTLVLDPTQDLLGKDEFMTDYSISPNGYYLAYMVSAAGADWQTIRIYDLQHQRRLKDELNWVKLSNISWHKDGFFYSRYPAPDGYELSGINEFHQLYYHRLGDVQAKDELRYADRRHPRRNVRSVMTEDQRYLILQITGPESGMQLYFVDLRSGETDFTPIYEQFGSDFTLVGSERGKLLFRTNHNAPKYRVVQVRTTNPAEQFWEELIPEAPDVLQHAALYGNRIVTCYLRNVASQLHLFDRTGKERVTLPLPRQGTITAMEGSASAEEAFYVFSNFLQPDVTYRLDLRKLQAEVYRKERTDFDGDRYVTKQVWYESYDGTQVPMYIIHRRGLRLDGTNPTLLYGYGGFNRSMSPKFNLTGLQLLPVFLENNGVCAIPNIRGGGELGSDWWRSGAGSNKQKAFDDFQAAAEYMIANKYTSVDKTAVYGRGHGGLLVTSCITQRPDLYEVAVSGYGPQDLLRYQGFSTAWRWTSEYGDAAKPEDFARLYRFSPLHNIGNEKFPATLLTTAERDGQVVPAHAYKFTATLQDKHRAADPMLISVASRAGHSTHKPVAQLIAEGAEVLSFIFYNLEENVVYQ